MTKELAIKEITTSVATSVRWFIEANELQLPADYSAENALKSAALILQNMKVDSQPVLMICNSASIKNSLLSMVVQGMNPDKKQGYFIPYGTTMTFQRSYFGNCALAKRLDTNIEDIYADIVYKGDEFEYIKFKGRTVIDKHKQKLSDIKRENITAAYATVIYKDGKENATIMTLEEINQAWKQSSAKPFDDKGTLKASSVHFKFMQEMCKKTVTSRACKPIINNSDDSNLIVKFARKSDDEAVAAQVELEVLENANQESIETEFTEVEGFEEPF